MPDTTPTNFKLGQGHRSVTYISFEAGPSLLKYIVDAHKAGAWVVVNNTVLTDPVDFTVTNYDLRPVLDYIDVLYTTVDGTLVFSLGGQVATSLGLLPNLRTLSGLSAEADTVINHPAQRTAAIQAVAQQSFNAAVSADMVKRGAVEATGSGLDSKGVLTWADRGGLAKTSAAMEAMEAREDFRLLAKVPGSRYLLLLAREPGGEPFEVAHVCRVPDKSLSDSIKFARSAHAHVIVDSTRLDMPGGTRGDINPRDVDVIYYRYRDGLVFVNGEHIVQSWGLLDALYLRHGLESPNVPVRKLAPKLGSTALRQDALSQVTDTAPGKDRDGLLGSIDLSLRVDFGQALASVKAGYRIARAGWNGRDMYVWFPKDYHRMLNLATGVCKIEPCLFLHNSAGGEQPGWLPSQADLFANDWYIMPKV